MRLPACSQLPQLADRGFSLLSLNVLLPNSVDGWWIYKMYGPGVPRAATAWDARSVLLRDLVLEADADVVAFQETSAESFTTDFGWMIDAGYDFELHAKGRMRPATFWKRARLAPCTADGNPVGSSGSPAIHGDRTLTTPLVLLGEGGEPCGQPPLFVINCHLSAGQEARRRLRQVHEALEAVRKAREKLAPKGKGGKGGKGVKSPADESAAEASVVVCGDFNSQGRSGVRQLLCEGEVRPDFRESGDPTEKDKEEYEVTSKVKVQRLGRFADAAELACAEGGEAVAPTLIAPELQSKMEAEGGGASPALLEAVGDMFRAMSADGVGMSGEEQTRWLTTINGKVGRGDEYRSAEAAKLERGSDVLSEDDLVRVYTEELRNGKFWGIEHDVRAVRGHGLSRPGELPFTARFDYVYFTAGSLALVGTRPALPAARMESLLDGSCQIPNEWYPSDHLPVAAAFEFARATTGTAASGCEADGGGGSSPAREE